MADFFFYIFLYFYEDIVKQSHFGNRENKTEILLKVALNNFYHNYINIFALIK